jgi:hypothetical protein
MQKFDETQKFAQYACKMEGNYHFLHAIAYKHGRNFPPASTICRPLNFPRAAHNGSHLTKDEYDDPSTVLSSPNSA